MIPILFMLLICINTQSFTVVRDNPVDMTNYIQLSSVLGDDFYMDMDRSALYVEPCSTGIFKVVSTSGDSDFESGDYVCYKDDSPYVGNQGRY